MTPIALPRRRASRAALWLCLSLLTISARQPSAYASDAASSQPDDSEIVPVCVRHAPPCADEDLICWQCAAVVLALKLEAAELDVTRLRDAWRASDEHARAQERLAEHATAAAKEATATGSPRWYLHPALWFAAGAIVMGGAAVAGAIALGAR